MHNIASHLKKERRRLGFSQLKASVICGVSRVSYRAWETANCKMPFEAALKLIAHGFDFSALNFAFGNNKPSIKQILSWEQCLDLARKHLPKPAELKAGTYKKLLNIYALEIFESSVRSPSQPCLKGSVNP